MDNSYKCTSKRGPPLHSDDSNSTCRDDEDAYVVNNVFIRISNDPKTKMNTKNDSETDNLLSSFCTFLSFDCALKLYVQTSFLGVFLQVPSSQKKQRNQTIEFYWGLYCLVVLFLLLYVICGSVPKEGTLFGLNLVGRHLNDN